MKLFAAVMFASVLLAADSGQDLFQKGLVKERTEADFRGAIKLYERVVKEYPRGRKLAAQALLRIAECEQTLGDTQARTTYERVVGEFADQSDIATTARKQLAALGGTTSSTLTARRIDVVGGSSISADGRWMAIIDRAAGGDVAVRDMSTGQINRLMANVGPEKCGTAEAPVLSPDVRQVAFLCYEHDPDNPSRSLRVMANEPGAKSRILVRNREFLYVTPAAWSSDGKAILVQLWRFDNTAQLAWVSAVDGSVKPLKSLEWRQPDRPSVSPDGRYITYSALVRAGSEERHIFVLMTDGSGETELVKTAGVNSAPVWMPDGAHILFSSDQSGSLSLWSLPFRNGKAAGSASLVKADIGRISPIGVTRSGSYYYVQTRGGEDVFAADFRDGKVQGVSRISDRFVGSNHGAAWSPDGRFMAFKRQRLGQATWLSGYDVVVRSLETGEEKTYAGALTTGMPLRLSWSHDGKAILLGAADKQNRISYQRLDLNTGQWEEIAPGVGIHGAFSPDDKTLYVSDDFGIVAIELATGQRRLVASVPDGLAGLAVSPDGRTLALVTAGISGGKERLLVVGTGASVEVIESARAELQALSPGRSSTFANTLAAKDPLPRIMSRYPGYRELYVRVGEKQLRDSGGCDCMLAFTRDSSEVLFGSVGSGGLQLMRVPVGGGGKPELTGLVTHGAGHSLDLSPDGTRIAFSDGVPTVSEVWALDNLLPALKATAK